MNSRVKLAFVALAIVSTCQSQFPQGEPALSLQPPPPVAPSFQMRAASSSRNFFPFLPSVRRNNAQSPSKPQQFAHQAVLLNAEQEAKLSPDLLNPFYKNEHVAQALAKASWFAPGEDHVLSRDSEKIPRERIVYALKSAGLAKRRRRRAAPPNKIK